MQNLFTYANWVVLAMVNLWPDDGLPEDNIAFLASSHSEGDPRGEVTILECRMAVSSLYRMGMVHTGPATDGTERKFIYPSKIGKRVFEDEKELRKEQFGAAKLRKRKCG